MPYADRIYRPDKRSEPYFWPNEQHEGYLNMDYYGGDLPGIRKKLTYLASLGVTCIYLNPHLRSPRQPPLQHRGLPQGGPGSGGPTRILQSCAAPPKPAASTSCWTACSATPVRIPSTSTARAATPPSAHGRDRTARTAAGTIFSPNYPHGYRCWWGFETLPEVNEEDRSYREFICGEGGVIDYWLGLGASGFRPDVADELPDDFIGRSAAPSSVTAAKKYLLGEVWEDATNKWSYGRRRTYLLGKGRMR